MPGIESTVEDGAKAKPIRARAWQDVVREAALPAEISGLVSEVVRRSRLWKSERAEVARELCAHFADGLEAGRTPAELVALFGNVRSAAALITRGAGRKRPLWWKTWRLGMWGTVCGALACIGLYGVLAIVVAVGRPTISRHFAAELNERLAGIPEDRRAWPRYAAIKAGLGAVPDELFHPRDSGGTPFDSSRTADQWPQKRESSLWGQAAAWVDARQGAIGELRRVAVMPELGCPCYSYVGKETMGGYTAGEFGSDMTDLVPAKPDTPLVAIRLPFLSDARYLARILMADARRALEVGDGARFTADAEALIGLAMQAGQDHFLISQLIRIAILQQACDIIAEGLAADVLDEAQLGRVAHRLAGTGEDAVRINFDSERLSLRDVVQRTFTDDGNGGGHITYEGLKEIDAMTQNVEPSTPEIDEQRRQRDLALKALSPLALVVVGGRAETINLVDHWYDRAQQVADTPFWLRTGSVSIESEIETLRQSFWGRTGRYLIITTLFPAAEHAALSAHRVHQIRDATVAALGIEVYRRRHGAYPATLAACVPEVLPSAPVDRFDGGPIKYRLVGSGATFHPVLYSIGTDRVDDGGVGPAIPGVEYEVQRFRPAAQVQAWMTDPTWAARIRGDWILYDPAGVAGRLPQTPPPPETPRTGTSPEPAK